VRLVAGWQAVAELGGDRAGASSKGAASPDEEQALPALREGQRLDGSFEALPKQTRPPPRHNEASLLGAMEYAGRDIEDEELRAAMRDTGLGTPATRAATIETLLRRRFIVREGKHLLPTDLGISLIRALPVASLASPELTGAWEARLARVARAGERRADFMADIARYVADMVAAFRGTPPEPARPAARATATATPTATATKATTAAGAPRCPLCRQGTLIAGKRGWGCARWREGCSLVIWFQVAEHRISDAELRDLIAKGRTRRRNWPRPQGGDATRGRLVLDLAAPREAGAARFEPG
jgi:DNA topoisomerase-3